MSSESSGGSHRHDTGHPAHGPESTTQMTTALQGVLGICIVIACALAIWTLLAAT